MNKGRKANRAIPRRRPVLLLTLGVLLLLTAVLIWIAFPDQTAQAPGAGPYTSVGDIPRVELAEAKEAYDGKSAVFLDVRTTPEYEDGRIPGAVSIPLAELEGRMGELNREDQIITYCT